MPIDKQGEMRRIEKLRVTVIAFAIYSVSATIAGSPAKAGETVEIIKCPPSLDYCYKVRKPVENHMRQQDEESRIIDQLNDTNGCLLHNDLAACVRMRARGTE